ncbi:DNA internalization-related competence protein ComEC/Rec2 [Lacicoccus alkaliphilus]|nr:DNA internalization-related competence protein ComEC/Rec2 [Salinicoccus alkaliphilus]
MEEVGLRCTGPFDVAEIKRQRNFLKQDEASRYAVNNILGRIYLEELEEERCEGGDKDFQMWLAHFRNTYMQKVLEYTEYDYKYDLLTLTVGNKSYIESEFFEALQRLGIYHLFVISGTHVAFITAVLYFILRKMRLTSGSVKLLLIASLLIFYMMNIYSPSVFRAVFMAIMLILASFFRKKPYLTVISLSALLQMSLNPYIVFHAGFQLSYITTYFILLSRTFIHGNSPLTQLIQITLISEVATFLIILIQFNEISISGIIMNLIFVPFFSLVIFPMVIIFQLLLLLPYIPAVDHLYHFVFSWSKEVIYFLADMIKHRYSIKNLNAPIYIVVAVLSYMMAADICRLNFFKVFLKGAVFITLIFTANITDRDDFTFTMIDVGQGDAFLIEDHQSDITVLIDTGGQFTFGGRESLLAERTVLPYLKERGIDDIDLLVLSHMDIDHVGEVEDILEAKNVRNLLVNSKDPKFVEWSQSHIEGKYNGNILASKDIKTLEAGHILMENLTLDDGLEGADSNDSSIVLKVSLGDYDFLMTGDVTEAVERKLLESGEDLTADVLKLAHHGSATSSSNGFIEEVSPAHVLVSAGADNRYGHPHEEVIDRVSHTNILSTAEAGMVQLNIRDETMCIISRLDPFLNQCTKKELITQLP